MNEMANAQLMLTYARNFFKGSLKTDNKVFSMNYGVASPQRKQKRLDNSEKASEAITKSRQYHNIDALSLLSTIPPELRAGNCNEYTFVALQFGMAMKIPNIWLAEHEVHVFLVLADESKLKNDLPLKEFSQYGNDNFWVCDPWFNIHCKLDMYGPMATLQASRWSIAGKEVCSYECFQEPANQWCLRLFEGEIKFQRMTDSVGIATQECDYFFNVMQ
ncbi:hypothetical protein NX722_05805 [Endozoicomonas gorgoniicola]|uniref:Uncharacterized protein n=1 Tax=Endozoicomonas gorgoniicola TaxID=1234144 RepID=A0ABT3MS12_9GAMM|nr:hypothetical protein [Endozoicomonas gorgoniicola]MCW7552168.1 hypothetical protein [Endozoicomonas gorgoniicola]